MIKKAFIVFFFIAIATLLYSQSATGYRFLVNVANSNCVDTEKDNTFSIEKVKSSMQCGPTVREGRYVLQCFMFGMMQEWMYTKTMDECQQALQKCRAKSGQMGAMKTTTIQCEQ